MFVPANARTRPASTRPGARIARGLVALAGPGEHLAARFMSIMLLVEWILVVLSATSSDGCVTRGGEWRFCADRSVVLPPYRTAPCAKYGCDPLLVCVRRTSTRQIPNFDLKDQFYRGGILSLSYDPRTSTAAKRRTDVSRRCGACRRDACNPAMRLIFIIIGHHHHHHHHQYK